jgi:hypothetical protein
LKGITHAEHMKLPHRRHTSAAERSGCFAQIGPPGSALASTGALGALGPGGGSGGGVSDMGGSGGGADDGGGALAEGSRSTAKMARQLGQVNCPPPGTWTVFSQ